MREEDLKTPEERLARLEVMSENSSQDRALIRQDIAQLDERLDIMDTKLDGVLNKFTSMEGKIGGALWVLGTLFTSLALFGDWLWKHLKAFAGS